MALYDAMHKSQQVLKLGVYCLITTLMSIGSAFAAPTLVVTDIDDTIKVSHVLSKIDVAQNAIETGNVFAGMPEIFQLLATRSSGKQFYYVSNAPELLMYGMHQDFLDENQFPTGELYLNPELFAPNHKVMTISKLIMEQNPKLVILIGDNGEGDSKIYAKIQSLFPRVQFLIYIHEVYSVKNRSERPQERAPGQRGFATSAELGYLLATDGQLDLASISKMIKSNLNQWTHQDLEQDQGSVLMPAWQDCRGYQSPLPEQSADGYLIALRRFIQARCQMGPQ